MHHTYTCNCKVHLLTQKSCYIHIAVYCRWNLLCSLATLSSYLCVVRDCMKVFLRCSAKCRHESELAAVCRSGEMNAASEPAPLWKTQWERLLIALVWWCWWSVFFPSVPLCSTPSISSLRLSFSLNCQLPILMPGIQISSFAFCVLSLLVSLSTFFFLSFSLWSSPPSLSLFQFASLE